MILFSAGRLLALDLQATVIVIVWMGLWAAQGLLVEISRGFHDIRAATVLGEVIANVVSTAVLAIVLALAWHLALAQVLAVILAGLVSSLLLSIGAVRQKPIHLPTGSAARLALLSEA